MSFLPLTNEEDPPWIEDSEDCDKYIAEFVSGRNLYDIKTKDKEHRQVHDKKYQKHMKNEERRLKKSVSGAPKKYREEAYNKHSKCDAQFVNNLHTYKTCDGGSGYRAEQKHYAVDFVIDKNSCDKTAVTSNLKKLKIYSKNKTVNEWLNEKCAIQNKPFRRAVSCMDLSLESLECETDRSKKAAKRRYDVDFGAYIQNLDPSFLPENWEEQYGLDTSRLLRELSLSTKHLLGHVNSKHYRKGDIGISKVLFSTDDLYAYVIPEDFDSRKALLDFSAAYEKWNKHPKFDNKQNHPGIDEHKTTTFYTRINVVLYLKEFEKDKTAYRRARHICSLPYDFLTRRDLYLELDTGELRVVSASEEPTKMLHHRWAFSPPAILEVRFEGAKTQKEVRQHIEAIRATCRARVVSIDTVDRVKSTYGRLKEFYASKWCTVDTVVLQTYRSFTKANLTTLFCEDKDCRGMCSTDVYFNKPSLIDDIAPALEKLVELRKRFVSDEVLTQTPENLPLAAYILPITDDHQNERFPEHYARLKFLSGFNGTDGCALITFEKALLWTDNQHFKIAQREVDTRYWTVKNRNDKSTESMTDWILHNIQKDTVIGFDPTLMSIENYMDFYRCLAPEGIHFIPISNNIIDGFWKNRPFLQGDVVKIMNLGESGKMPSVKIDDLRKELQLRKCTATVVSALDDVMWILNIRGNDLEFSPLTYSYLFVTLHEAHLFIDLGKLDKEAQAHLTRAGVKFHAYRTIYTFLTEWWERVIKEHHKIFLTPDTNCSILIIFKKNYTLIEPSIVQIIKAMKNPMELEGMRDSNIRHSVAIVEFLHWIEKEMNDGRRYTEVQLRDKIEQFEATHEKYVGMSLPTVFSSAENSSNPKHMPISSHTVSHMQQFLLQSGCQYQNGTTLAARTVWDSEPSDEFVQNYTLILQGHIKLASAKFPDSSTVGSELDLIAKSGPWKAGIEPKRETGHGVGHYLNVREMPDYEDCLSDRKIEAGQVITIEPGFYKKDQYGIQIGNCYETILVPSSSEEKLFLEFKPLTLIPIQTSTINKKLLEPDEILWLNKYHYRVNAQIGAILRDEKKIEALAWLEKACEPI